MTTPQVTRNTRSLSDIIYQSPTLTVYTDNGRLVADFNYNNRKEETL